jgi:NitT/TauT family transport system permease protein
VRPQRLLWQRTANWALPLGALAALIALWQLLAAVFSVPAYLLPPPSTILSELLRNWHAYFSDTVITGIEVIVGFVISVAIGVPTAILLAYSKVFARSVYPLIVTSQTVPKVALAPLFVVWFGFGMVPKVGVAVLIAFFPIVIASVVGFRSVPDEMLQLVRSMGAGRIETFRRVILPYALPSIFSGMKVASTLAVIGAVVAEFIGANGGLGYIIMTAQMNVNVTEEFTGILILSLMGIVFFALLSALERVALPWHTSVRREDLATLS